MKRAAVCLALLAGLSGCKTHFKVERINRDQFYIQDKGTTANPEKGLNRTCPRIGRSIVKYRWVGDSGAKGIVVDCGPKVKR